MAKKPVKKRSVNKRVNPKPTNLTEHKHTVFGLYGDSGIGKTRLIGSLTEGRVMIIRTPLDHINSILSAGLGSNIEERVIRDWSDSNDLRDELRATGAKYDWVWLDSASLWQDAMMDDVWADTIHDRPDRYRYGLDKPEYGINQLRMGNFIRPIIGADLFNFGWTAHANMSASPDLDEDGDPIEKLMPAIHGGKGSIAVKWCGYSTIVAYYRKDKKSRRILHTESSAIYYAKNQYDPKGVDWEMVNPTMPEILARVKAGPRRKKKSTTKKRRPASRRA